jgi:CspA family cold shock protein
MHKNLFNQIKLTLFVEYFIKVFNMNGNVKWFNKVKGFGFITTEEGKEIFVHFTGITSEGFRTLKQGEAVVFDIEDGTKGPQAVNVKPAE